ncbi:hypothetical protein MMC31_003773 [Peltigera leucophlebia]|nr:hypothetical protein [Peltigera leucophlebia]
MTCQEADLVVAIGFTVLNDLAQKNWVPENAATRNVARSALPLSHYGGTKAPPYGSGHILLRLKEQHMLFMPGSNVDRCIATVTPSANPPPESILEGAPYGNKVVKISDQAVIKFGVGVTEAEAVNQSEVYELVDPQVVRIPKVYRYFSDDEHRGYIVMDFVKGEVLDPLEDPVRVKVVAGILDHLASFRRIVPGPCAYGPPCGLLFFPDEGEVPFTDVKDLEQWWNCRLLFKESAAKLQGLEQVLCHLDVAPRNVLWKDDEAPCLLDWASAGYYPRVFEFCAQLIVEGKDARFNRLLLDAMTKLECVESEQIAPVLQAWSNMQRYQFPRRGSPSKIPINPTQSERFREKVLITGPPLPPYPNDWLDLIRSSEGTQV